MDVSKPDNEEQTGISILPIDIRRLLCTTYLDGTNSFNLLKASPRLFLPVNKSIKQHPDHPLRKLLSHAALGEWKDAQAIWSKDPTLLTMHGTVYHPSPNIPADLHPGRYKYVDLTAWQIALMNEEYEVAEEMEKFMTATERQKQFDQIFPDGQIIKYNWDLEEAKELLIAVFSAVFNDLSIRKNTLLMNEVTKKALAALYNYVKPKPEHRIGLVSDINIYIEALKLYNTNINQFHNWHRCKFWCVRVEELLASLTGTRYLRAHTQGLFNPLDPNGCVLKDKSSYFPHRRSPDSVPGIHFFIGILDFEGGPGTKSKGNVGASYRVNAGSGIIDEFFTITMAKQNNKRNEFMQRYSRLNVFEESSLQPVCR